MSGAKYTKKKIKELTDKKRVYIYAANLEGVGYCKLFTRMKIDVRGFIDSRKYDGGEKIGKPVIHPDTFFASDDVNQTFVLIATKHRKSKKLAIEQCEKAGLVRDLSFVIVTDLCENLPTIEVVGACNLKCISCDMGLSGIKQGGLMTPETYQKVLIKMTEEIPFMNSVCLYLWGEPFVHPDLPEIIRITHEFGIATDISSNLNYGKHIERIVEVAPDLLTVPCSGIGKNYEMSHTGGNWESYKENLYSLRKYIDKYKSDTTVRVIYHMYKHNLEEDYNVVETIAKELGFYFFPILTNIFPGNVYEYAINEIPLPPEMQKANEMLIIPVDEQLKHAYDHKGLFCPVIKAFPTVRWDLSVLHCCNMVNPTVPGNYLEVSLEEFVKRRETASTCSTCMSKGVHRYFDVNATVKFDHGKRVVSRK